MANRIVGKTYIIDSASGLGASLPWPTAGLDIHTIVFYAQDSGSKFELVYSSDTSNSAISIANPNTLAATIDVHFGEPHLFTEALYVKTLNTGTAWLYFR